AGSLLLTRIKASKLLTVFAFVAAVLCFVVWQTSGATAGYAALSIGLFNSIMFPAIFTITLERSSASTASTSGLLCLAIVGGALLPQVVARVADAGFLHGAYVVPAIAYLVIVLFAARSAEAPIVAHSTAPAAAPGSNGTEPLLKRGVAPRTKHSPCGTHATNGSALTVHLYAVFRDAMR